MTTKKHGPQKVVITDYTFDNLDLESEVLAPLGCRLVALKAGKDQALIDLVKDADAVITPHVAAVSPQAVRTLRGAKLPNIVNGVRG